MPKRKPPVADAPAVPLVPVVSPDEKLAKIDGSSPVAPSAIREMMQLIPPSRIAERIDFLLNATRETGRGKHLREIPDTRAIEVGVKLYLSYVEGLPVQRIEQINTTVESENQLVERMRYSPATLRHMEALIEQIKAEQAGGGGS